MRVFPTTAALAAGLALGASAVAVTAQAAPSLNREGIQHVLLISIDGMHSVDFINCAHGIASVDNGASYCPHLAELRERGVDYLDSNTSRPSDSFPGLMSIVSGGLPRSLGVYYDVAYDRSLAPPAVTTGNGLSAGNCTPGHFPGTTTEYEEGIDIDQGLVNGGAPGAGLTDGTAASIDPQRLVRDPAHGCAPVYPWNFVRLNTIFSVIHQAGGYAAWSDKHPAYASVSGPQSGSPVNLPHNLDDFYAPEINSNVVGLPGVATPTGVHCDQVQDPNADLTAWTNSFVNIQCYDQLKVNGILNQIEGWKHNRSARAPVPNIFGMNFQAVSVGQKLIEPAAGVGGYSDASGTPNPALVNEIQYVDATIGQFVAELQKQGLRDSTLIVITAKHGQSPIDTARYVGITSAGPVTTSPSRIIDSCLPDSESNAGNQIGPTEDDVSLLWLRSTCDAATEAALIESSSPTSNNVAGVGQIFYGPAITQLFNAPGLPPKRDPRTPDIVVTSNVGVTYSGSTAKHAEHGGFAHDDTNVMLLVSHPSLERRTVTVPVATTQVAPTILKALGLSPASLHGVQIEGTAVLPGTPWSE
jgi:hypothetical protein